MFSKGNIHAAAMLLCGAGSTLLSSCSQSSVQNSAPRLSGSIPDQSANGGGVFSLDLANYVTDRETDVASLSFTVVAGGGAFAGSTYRNTFDTLGTYTVTVRVTDPAGKSLETSFDVDVQTANLGVITSGNDLRLLDTDTLHSRPLASSSGWTVTFKAALTRGFVAYERQAGTEYDLYLYDANTTATVVLGDVRNVAERYAGKVGEDRLLFTAENATSRSLLLYDVNAGLTTVVAAVDGEMAGGALVNADGQVYYELTSGGQKDIYAFDPVHDTTTAVSTNPRAEQTVAVLADGGLVFSRRGDAGETDLFYYRRSLGVVEIGGDVAGIASQTKTFGGATASNLVAFSANNGGQLDFYVWNPAAGLTAAVGTSADNESFASVLPNGNILYYVLTGGTNLDVRLFDVALATSRAFPASAVNDLVVGTLSDSRVVVSKAEATGTHLYLATYNGTSVSDTPIVDTTGQSFTLEQVLANDKLVYRNVTSGGVTLFVPATSGIITFGATSQFVTTMPTAGDFVVKIDNGGQFDLSLWDDSADSIVPVATAATDEELARGLNDGRILFSRAVVGASTRNLFVWQPADQSVVQVTNDEVDHVVQTTFAADNR